jgi:hypothetical protein
MLPRRPNLRLVLGFLLIAGVAIPGSLYGGPLIVTTNEAIDDDSNATVGNAPPAALGQDDWDVPKKAADGAMNGNFVQQGQWNLPNFDQWVLRNRTRDQIEKSFKQMLALQVQNVGRACELSAAQREKLQMAAEYDLKRMSRAIDELREKFRQAGQDQETYSRLINEGSTMQMSLQSGIYGESSLFQKVLRQTLDREQSLRYERQERERRKFRYEAKIELVMSNLEGSISLTAEQRQRLVKLLVDETEPPKKFGPYDTYVVFWQLGKLGEAKLKPILDDSQRKSLKGLLDRYRGMENMLQSQGYL